MFWGSCADLLAFHTLQTVVHAVKQGVHGPEAMTHIQLSAAPSVSVDFHSRSPWLSVDFGVEHSGLSVKHSGSWELNFLPKVSQVKSKYYLFTSAGTYDKHFVAAYTPIESAKNAYRCLVDLRHLCTIWHHSGITAGSMHHIKLCYQYYENYHNNLQTEKNTFTRSSWAWRARWSGILTTQLHLTIMIKVKITPYLCTSNETQVHSDSKICNTAPLCTWTILQKLCM